MLLVLHDDDDDDAERGMVWDIGDMGLVIWLLMICDDGDDDGYGNGYRDDGVGDMEIGA